MSQLMTADQFVKSEMKFWSVEYIEDLLEQGYEPVQVTDNATGLLKWSWLQPANSYINT